MSKDCGHHVEERRQILRRIFAGILTFIILILLIIFLIWIILKPTKPNFIIQDVTVYAFNLSSTTAATTTTEPSFSSPTPYTLTTTMQVTLSSFNPNKRIGIYYQKLDVYASYHEEKISSSTVIPVTYQGHREAIEWSPFLYGDAVPVSPYMLSSLQQDQEVGGTLVNVKVNGRVKWKVGTWVSGRYHIDVNCPAHITLAGGRNNAIGVATAVVKFQLDPTCNVDV